MITNRKFAKAGLIALFAGSVGLGFWYTVQAQWQGPTDIPYIEERLVPVLDTSLLVSKTEETLQTVAGGARFSNVGSFPALVGYSGTAVSPALGAAGLGLADEDAGFNPDFSSHAIFSPMGTANVGLLGLAVGGASNYGIYVVSEAGVGLIAQSDTAGGEAAYFIGNVEIEDADAAAGYFSSEGTVSFGDHVAISRASGETVVLDAPAAVGSSLAGNIVSGIIGSSVLDSGLYASGSTLGLLADGGSTVSAEGIRGEGPDYGIYGQASFNLSGHSFNPGNPAGFDVSVESGVGIFACGFTAAGSFEGNVTVAGGFSMGIIEEDYVDQADDVVIGRILTPAATLTETLAYEIFEACEIAGDC